MSFMQQHISLQEIDQMRKRILENLKEIELKKHLIQSHDRTKLTNHHNYILNTLDNMINTGLIEQHDPYNLGVYETSTNQYLLDPALAKKNVIYNKDGSTSLVGENQVHSTGDEWERQFDSSLLLNPPCYTLPPQGITDLNHVRQSSKGRRMNSLYDNRRLKRVNVGHPY